MNKLFLGFLMLLASAVHAGFYDFRSEGWFNFEEHKKSKEDKQEIEPAQPTAMTPTDQINRMTKTLEQKLHKAFINPTVENLKAYIIEQRKLFDNSERFANTWQRALIQNPEIDESLTVPIGHRAKQIYYRTRSQAIDHKVSALSQDYGLFFFYTTACPYCRAFAKTVKTFSEKYNWDVVAISLDGGVLPEFPSSSFDKRLAQKLQIKHLPALIAVHAETEQLIPVAVGMISIDEMLKRIDLMTQGAV